MNDIHPRISEGHIGQLIGHDGAAYFPSPLIQGLLDPGVCACLVFATCSEPPMTLQVYRPAYATIPL